MDVPLGKGPQGVVVARILIIGQSGTGKSVLAGKLAPIWGPPNKTIVIAPVSVVADEIPGCIFHKVDPQDLERSEQLFRHYYKEAERPYEDGGQDIVLTVDELEQYLTGGGGYGTGSKSLRSLTLIGRNFGFCQVFLAKGTAQLPKEVIDNSNLVLIAATDSPTIHRYMKDRLSDDCPQINYMIRHLPRYYFLVYSPESDQKVLGTVHYDPTTGDVTWTDLKIEQSQPTDENMEATEPSESANGEDATASSPTSTGPATAGSITPNSGSSKTPLDIIGGNSSEKKTG